VDDLHTTTHLTKFKKENPAQEVSWRRRSNIVVLIGKKCLVGFAGVN
jgi:hypothetical protein